MKPSEILGIINVNKKSDTRVFMLDKKALLMLDTKCIDREELKNKINKLIKKLEKSLVKLTNTDRAYQQGKIEQLRELLKLL